MEMKADALFFDVNETLLDLTPLRESMSTLFGNDRSLVELWFTRLLHYSLVTGVSGQFRPFEDIAVAVAEMTLEEQGLPCELTQIRGALAPLSSLQPHPDVKPALKGLRELRLQLVAFSNSSAEPLHEKLDHAGLTGYFDRVLSVEQAGHFKPDRRAYEWAAGVVGTTSQRSVMIACHPWDTAGASWAGWQSVFLNRGAKSPYPLGPDPTLKVEDLTSLVQIMKRLKEQ